MVAFEMLSCSILNFFFFTLAEYSKVGCVKNTQNAPVLFLNIRSLKEHHQDICQYISADFNGFLCFH